jgi:hypothetical protein
MSRLFVIVCALLSVFISISGFVTARRPVDLVFQVMFLPVTGFLVNAVFTDPRMYLADRKVPLVVTTALFVILIGWGLIRIFGL